MRLSSSGRNIDNGAIGWISTADIFMMSTFFLFLLCSTLAVRSQSDEEGMRRLVELRDQNQALEVRASKADGLVEQVKQLELQADASSVKERRLNNELLGLAEQVKQLELQADASSIKQRRLNNELLGLGGGLRKVAILVDVSKSMKSGVTSSEGESSWKRTKTIIRRWIQNLDVGNAALILFGDDAHFELPMQTMDAPHRQSIVDAMNRIDPNDESTNFLAAFRLAYTLPELDTIIVFSDGLPTIDLAGKRIQGPRARLAAESQSDYERFRTEVIQENVKRVLLVHNSMQQLAKSHPGVAINAIGLGENVYTAQTGNLLNDLAFRNNGVFIAIPSN